MPYQAKLKPFASLSRIRDLKSERGRAFRLDLVRFIRDQSFLSCQKTSTLTGFGLRSSWRLQRLEEPSLVIPTNTFARLPSPPVPPHPNTLGHKIKVHTEEGGQHDTDGKASCSSSSRRAQARSSSSTIPGCCSRRVVRVLRGCSSRPPGREGDGRQLRVHHVTYGRWGTSVVTSNASVDDKEVHCPEPRRVLSCLGAHRLEFAVFFLFLPGRVCFGSCPPLSRERLDLNKVRCFLYCEQLSIVLISEHHQQPNHMINGVLACSKALAVTGGRVPRKKHAASRSYILAC